MEGTERSRHVPLDALPPCSGSLNESPATPVRHLPNYEPPCTDGNFPETAADPCVPRDPVVDIRHVEACSEDVLPGCVFECLPDPSPAVPSSIL